MLAKALAGGVFQLDGFPHLNGGSIILRLAHLLSYYRFHIGT
jgi:hypothetical protein